MDIGKFSPRCYDYELNLFSLAQLPTRVLGMSTKSEVWCFPSSSGAFSNEWHAMMGIGLNDEDFLPCFYQQACRLTQRYTII